jgi:hypothetical protein
MTKHLSILALVFSLGSVAFAGPAVFTNIHHQYESIRALGMGDAFTAIANDESALFYNPAAYARFTEGNLKLSLIDVAGSANLPTLQNYVNTFTGSGASNTANVVQALNAMYGNQYSFRIKPLETAYARPNWGFAFVPADITTDFGVNAQAAPALSVRAYADSTLGVGYGRTIRNQSIGLLSWGTTVKFIQREYVSTEVNALDIATSSDSSTALKSSITNGGGIMSDGYTTDVDLGMLYTPYWPESWNTIREMRPTLGIVGHNLIDGGFGQQFFKTSPQNGTPEQLYRVWDIGTRFEMPRSWWVKGRFAIDERDYDHPQFNWKKGFHTGAEIDWGLSSWWKGQWRFGWSENALTGGFSALFTVFRLDIATFAEDIGTYNNPVTNRVYELRLVLDI